MDTHVASHSDIEPSSAGLSARLPEELDEASPATGVDAGERLPSSAARPGRRRRGMLLAGVAVAALAIAGGAFLVSPFNTVYPVPRLQASVNTAANNAAHYAQTTLRPILAPSASLATVAVPPTLPATRDAYTPKPRYQQVAELLSLHPGQAEAGVGSGVDGHPAKTPADHAPAKPAPAVVEAPANSDVPSGYIPREPGSSPAPQAAAVVPPPLPPAVAAPKDATALIIAALPKVPAPVPDSQAAPAPIAVSKPVDRVPSSDPAAVTQPAAPQADALATAAGLRAGPMSPPEQVQVLNLVTEMAQMVKDLRKQQAQLRADLGKSSADMTSRLTDYERRLAFAEARSAVTSVDDASGGAPPKPAEPASESGAPSLRPIQVVASRPVAVVPSPLVPSAPKIYRVQAASPGLALLAQVDRGGGDGAQMQVVVGDNVPDYGRVKSIAQKGTAWIVTTEHGAIQ